MPRYAFDFLNVSVDAGANVAKTLAAVITANTAGHRARMRAIHVGPGDATPADKNVSISLNRVQSVLGGGAGTSTPVAAASISKFDPGAIDSLASGGVNYTAEPTVYDTEPFFRQDMNTRAALIKEWPDPDEAPSIGPDMLLGLLAETKDASPIVLSGSIEFETY